jgi:hypothetical protein
MRQQQRGQGLTLSDTRKKKGKGTNTQEFIRRVFVFDHRNKIITNNRPATSRQDLSSSLRDCIISVHVFRNLITDDDAATLREYLINVNVATRERLPAIAKSQRRSFPLTPLEHPVSSKVLRGIASNAIFHDTLEAFLGPDPAWVALSTIISEKGAPHQTFHLDKPHDGSHIQYPFTFAPNYALFIPLQDTPASMGATAMLCPGTHYYCASVANQTAKETICEEFSFAVQDNMQYDMMPWKAGDG